MGKYPIKQLHIHQTIGYRCYLLCWQYLLHTREKNQWLHMRMALDFLPHVLPLQDLKSKMTEKLPQEVEVPGVSGALYGVGIQWGKGVNLGTPI